MTSAHIGRPLCHCRLHAGAAITAANFFVFVFFVFRRTSLRWVLQQCVLGIVFS